MPPSVSINQFRFPHTPPDKRIAPEDWHDDAGLNVDPNVWASMWESLEFDLNAYKDAILADRWRYAVGEMLSTPAEDANFQPADIGMIDGLATRVLRHSVNKAELMRFQDVVLFQNSDNDFQNFVQVKVIMIGSNTGDASLNVRVRPVDVATGQPAGAFQSPITVPFTYNGSPIVADLKFDIGIYNVDQMLGIQIDRNAQDPNLDTVGEDLGVIAARLV